MDIRVRLLSDIINSKGVYYGKYTDAYNNLKNVIDLELDDRDNELSDNIIKEFKTITKQYNSFWKSLNLTIIEQFFMRNNRDLGYRLPIEYKDEYFGEVQIIELYELLEDFFKKVFKLAVRISDLYSYEIKFKDTSNASKDTVLK